MPRITAPRLPPTSSWVNSATVPLRSDASARGQTRARLPTTPALPAVEPPRFTQLQDAVRRGVIKDTEAAHAFTAPRQDGDSPTERSDEPVHQRIVQQHDAARDPATSATQLPRAAVRTALWAAAC